jgi:hopanoid biosynthesis associated protein HpnK
MTKLIVNADDFGINDNVNVSILESFKNGILRSASLLANGEAFESAVQIIKSNPKLDIGVHLTLTDGKPVLDSPKLVSLVNERGKFHNHAIDLSERYFLSQLSFNEIKKEFTAQIEKILDNGINISHIDSHQHVHILPQIFSITSELANHYKIEYVRLPKEYFHMYMFFNPKFFLRICQMVAVNYMCSKVKKYKISTTDYFLGFYFGGRLNKKNLLLIINSLPPDGVCELMCHPGLVGDLLIYQSGNYRREQELTSLVDKEVQEAILSKQIQIASFADLNNHI